MGTGAESHETITHAFVLNGFCWAWSMLEGEKVFPNDDESEDPSHIDSKYFENRHGRLAPGWYAVILGKGRKGDTKAHHDMCKFLLPKMEMPPLGWSQLKFRRGCVVGVVKISHSLPYEICKNSPWANGMPVCNVISQAGWIDKPIPCKGNLGACPIKDADTLLRVRQSARNAKLDGNIFKTLGDEKYPAQADAWKKHKAKSVAATNKEKELKRLSDYLVSTQNKRLNTGRESPA